MKGSDEQIKKDVVDQVYWDGRVDASKVNVDVRDGVVDLKGKVPDYSAFHAAEEDAWSIPKVIGVNNLLVVEYPGRVNIPSDEEIKKNINNMLLLNSYIDEANIDVSVQEGIVKLEGTVDSLWKKIRVEEIAYDMRGVLEVTNELAVVPTKDIVDQVIAEDIVRALERNAFVDADSVDVEVKNGKVTLSGEVTDWTAYRVAIDTARNTAGVTGINNNLLIA